MTLRVSGSHQGQLPRPLPRALPLRVAPLSGETPGGFAGRLAAANGLSASALNAWLSPADPAGVGSEPWRQRLERAASLPFGYFQHARRRHLLFAACHHSGWRRANCVKCDIVDTPRAGCIRCARGDSTTVFTRGGAVCVRHRRWHGGGLEVDLRGQSAYAHAEARASGWLWFHGVSLHTGELELAANLVSAALADGQDARRDVRLEQLNLDDGPEVSPLLLYYPEITNLACALTDPAVASALCTHRTSPERQVQMIIALAAGACDGAPTTELEALARAEIDRMRLALRCALSMPSSRTATVRRAPRPKALIEAGHRHKAVLMRHVDEARVSAPAITGVKPPPASRVVSRRLLLALQRSAGERQ